MDGVAVITAVGDVDLLSATRLRNATEFVIGNGPAALVVDLTRVAVLEPVGIEVLVDARRLMGPTSGFAVVAGDLGVGGRLRLVGPADSMTVVATLEEGLRAVAGGRLTDARHDPAEDQRRPWGSRPSWGDPSCEPIHRSEPAEGPKPTPPGPYVGRHRASD